MASKMSRAKVASSADRASAAATMAPRMLLMVARRKLGGQPRGGGVVRRANALEVPLELLIVLRGIACTRAGRTRRIAGRPHGRSAPSGCYEEPPEAQVSPTLILSAALVDPTVPGIAAAGSQAAPALRVASTAVVLRRSKLPAAIEQLRPFFGWSRDSEMPRLYGRTYFEAQVAKVWRDDFDVRVEFLRSVP